MGDDADRGFYMLDVPEATTVQELVEIMHSGGYGNTWPIPVYEDCCWVVLSNIGAIATLIRDHEQKLHIEYAGFDKDDSVKHLGILAVYACRPIKYDWKEIDENNYQSLVQRLLDSAEKSAGDYSYWVR